MSNPVTIIPITGLALGFIPVVIVAVALWRWSHGISTVFYASLRMVLQLLAIGYVLTFIFDAEHSGWVFVILVVMLLASSWIALRPLGSDLQRLFPTMLFAIATGTLFTLALVIIGILRPEPWFEPRVLIPIAGMIFSNAMNTVSLAAERFEAERERHVSYLMARREALDAAMIPLLNAFFAVGLVSLPGMMTGQILSGVEPPLAVRYQIMVMCMTFGAAGISAIVYLALQGPRGLRNLFESSP